MSLTESIAPTGGPTPCDVVTAIDELHEGIEERLTHLNRNLVSEEVGVVPELTDAVKELTLWVRMLGNGNAGTDWGGMEALGKAILDSGERVATSIDEHTFVMQQLLDKLK